jgi:hypothetical protein
VVGADGDGGAAASGLKGIELSFGTPIAYPTITKIIGTNISIYARISRFFCDKKTSSSIEGIANSEVNITVPYSLLCKLTTMAPKNIADVINAG